MLPRHIIPVTAQRQRKYRGQEEMLHCSPEAKVLAGDHDTLSLWVIILRPLNGHWRSSRATGRMWLQLFTHKYPLLSWQKKPQKQQHRGVVFSTTVAPHWDCVYSAAVDTNNCHRPTWPHISPKVLFICESSLFISMLQYRAGDSTAQTQCSPPIQLFIFINHNCFSLIVAVLRGS